MQGKTFFYAYLQINNYLNEINGLCLLFIAIVSLRKISSFTKFYARKGIIVFWKVLYLLPSSLLNQLIQEYWKKIKTDVK